MRKLLLLSTALSAGALMGPLALAQANEDTMETVVVSGFRQSLEAGLNLKRDAIGVRDSIIAEDIGKYPAANIAESLARVPGVVLSRDGFSDEGSRVTVRGLNSTFTILTLNDTPIHTTTGSNISASGGGTNRGVDLDAFGADLFNRVDFYKSPEATLPDGGVGGVIAMHTSHPFDYKEAQFHWSLGESVNSYRQQFRPRASLTASNTWGNFGALIALNASKTGYANEGSQVTGIAQSVSEPVPTSTTNPVTKCTNFNSVKFDFGPGTTAGCTDAQTTSTWAGVAPGANLNGYTIAQIQQAFEPRFLRSYVSSTDRTRFSGNISLQYKTDHLDITNDTLFAQLTDSRTENTFGIFFRTTGPTTAAGYAAAQANPALAGYGNDSGIIPILPTIDPKNNNLNGTFGNTGRYNESRFYDPRTRYIADWLTAKYEVSDNLTVNALGFAQLSNAFNTDNRIVFEQFGVTTVLDRTQNEKLPKLTGDKDPTDATTYLNNSNGTSGYAKSGKLNDRGMTARLEGDYKHDVGLGIINKIDVRFGVSLESQRQNTETRDATTPFQTKLFGGYTLANMPIGLITVNHISQMSDLFSDQNNAGMPTNWLSVPRSVMYGMFKPNALSLAQPYQTSNWFDTTEIVKSSFVQVATDGEVLGRPFRIGAGLRYGITTVSGHQYAGNTPQHTSSSYDDPLPSLSLSYEPTDDLVLRAGVAKTITRVALSSISGGISIVNTFNAQATLPNPGLKPMRSTNVDLGAEWYFAPQSVLSVGVYYKQLNGLPSSVTQHVPFGSLGLSSCLLAGSQFGLRDSNNNPIYDSQGCWQIDPNLDMSVTRPVNLNPLGVKGVELAYQQPFLFLPSPLDGFGVMSSLTWSSGNASGPGSAFTANNLVTLYKLPINGLAKWSYSATLYYEKGPFSVRGTYNWNSKTTTNGVGSQGAELQQWQQARGQLDASIAYDVTDDIEFRLEGSNLLNEVTYQFFADPATNSKIGSRYAATGIGSGGNENVTWQGRTFVFSIRGKL